MLTISPLSKAEALRRLYNYAKPQGMGWLHWDPRPMTLEQAQELIDGGTYFDYVKGRVLKVDLGKDEFSEALYDRDNGAGMAKQAIESEAP